MAYTIADIDGFIRRLETALSKGYSEVTGIDGQRLTNQSPADIMKAIGYFKGLYNSATDAPLQAPDTRTFFFYGGRR
jgi:hypothetical protein